MADKYNQSHTAFDNSPGRFRSVENEGRFSGASGLLFEQAMAQTRMAICLTDPNQEDDPIVFCNRAFRELTGYDEEEILGHNCRFLQGVDTDRQTVNKLRDAVEARAVAVVEILNYKKDGTPFWNALHIGPIYDDKNELKYLFGSQWDVTDVNAARADEQHARMMARELSHRIKNMFSVISAIVNMAGRERQQPAMADWITSRIQALGRAYESTLDEAKSGSTDIGHMTKAVLGPYDGGGKKISYHGDRIRLDTNIVSMLGLTLHELATNAIKYGALGAEHGEVAISWIRDGDDMLLDWKETGGPPVDQPPQDQGTGVAIVTRLLAAAEGTIEHSWKPMGLEVRIRVPIDAD